MRGEKNILIIGGGLAGTFMAASCCRAGHAVTLVDVRDPKAASQIAGGLNNVITGRKASRTWMAQTLLDSLHDFFQQDDLAHLAHFVRRIPIYRPYKTEEEFNTWMARSLQPDYAHMVRHCPQPRLTDRVVNPLGGLEILPCGWTPTSELLAAMQASLQERYAMRMIRSRLDYRAIQPDTGKVILPDGSADTYDHIVCCEGMGLPHNPWFGKVDLRPLKGQILDIELEGLPEDMILLRKVFFIPKGENIYTVGSTYEKYFSDVEPTEEGINELSSHIRQAIHLPFRVVDARAGLRPTSPNRRPILGLHPVYPRLAILNGLGTKGVLQAPWCAVRLTNLLDDKNIPPIKEVDVKRCVGAFS